MAGLSMIKDLCTRSILPPCPIVELGVEERHLEMAQPTTKKNFACQANFLGILQNM